MTTSLHRHPVALNLPGPVPALLLRGRHIVLAMSSSAWFQSLAGDLVELTADLDELESSEATTHTRAKGSASARNLKKQKVVDDLTDLGAEVQSIVNLHATEAAAIIESAGMFHKKSSARTKPNLAAVMGPTPGQVLVRARATRGAAYEWQLSSDGGATWVGVGLTTVANTSVAGLTRGTTCLFRFRTTRRDVTGDWSQIVSFLVH